MKKRTKLLVMMLLGVLLSINQMWAVEKTHTFSSFTATDGVATITDAPLTIVLDKKTNTAPPAWVSSTSEARLYAAGTLTISCEQTITKIVYNYTINANKSGVTPNIDGVSGTTNAGTWNAETKTWTGTDTEVTFSTSGSAGNVGFTSITVTYGSSSPTYTDYLTECEAPKKTIYLKPAGIFRSLGNEKMAVYDCTNSAWVDFMTPMDGCNNDYWTCEIPEICTSVIFGRYAHNATELGWNWSYADDKKLINQTVTVNFGENNCYSLTGWDNGNANGSLGTFVEKYNVTFSTAQGTTPEAQCVAEGGKVSDPNLRVAGYRLEGWYSNSSFTGSAWNFETNTITNETTLYAKWTAVPNRTIYLKLNDDWAAGEAKYAVYYYTNGTGWSGFMTKGTGCYDGYYYTEIPGTETNINIGRFNPSKAETGNWDDKWNQTLNINIPIEKNLVTVTTQYSCSCVDNGNYNSDLGVFSLPTYTINFVGGDGATGSMSDITDIACGSSQTIPANGFGAPAGKKFNGWKDQDENDYSAGATINPVTEDLTLTAQWADVPTWTITLNVGTGTVSQTSVNIEQGQAYGSSLPAAEPCASAASNGWTFAGWSATNVTEQTAIAPTFVKSTDVPGANTPLYAVYTSTAETGRLNKYKIYAATSGGDKYMMGDPYASNSTVNQVNPGTSAEAKVYTFIPGTGDNEGKTAIKFTNSSSQTKYLVCKRTGSSGSYNYYLQSQDDPYYWTISDATEKGSKHIESSYSGRGLIYSANNSLFKIYATSNVKSTGTDYHDLEFEDAGYEPVGETVYHSSPSCAEVYSIAVDNSVAGCDAAAANVATAAEGATITLSQTTNSCYNFSGWTIKKTSDMSDVTSEVGLSSNTFTMPAYGVTAVPTYAKKTYTITLHDGASTQTPSVDCGDAFSFSTYNPTPSCSDVEFVGWTATAPTDGGWASVPATVTNIASVTAAAEYYAVYGEATGAASWQKVTSMSGVVSGETYLIIYNDGSTKKSMNKNFDTDGYGSVNATITDNKVTGGNGKASQWQLIKSGTKYAFKNVDSGKYLGQSGMGLSQEDALWANWSITMNGETEVDIVANENHLVYGGVGDYPFSAFYSAQGDIYLFKSKKAVAYKATDACAAYHTITITTTGASVVTTLPADKAKAGDEVTISTALAAGEEIISQEVTSTCGTVEVTKGVFTMPGCDVTITTILGVSYKITYNKGTAPAAGATLGGSAAQQKKAAGEDIALAESGFTCGGYTLNGWATEDGGEKVYELGASYNEDADLTLYPVWTPRTDMYIDGMHETAEYAGEGKAMSGYYTIPILEDGDSGTTDCKTTHKKFIGWIAASNTNTDGTLKVDKEPFAGGTGKAATGATYYAVWAVVNE